MLFCWRYFRCALLLITLLAPTVALADQASDQYAVAAAHYAQTRWQLAIDEFQVFLRDHPQNEKAAEATFFLGEALTQVGRSDDAQKQFETLLTRWPLNFFARQAMFRRAETAYVAGHHQQAAQWLEEFTAKFPNDELNAYALPYLAEVMLTKNQADRARQLFDKAASKFPNGPMREECRLGLAKADEATGKLDAARKAYSEMATDGRLALEARLRLGTLENSAGNYDAALAAFDALIEKSAEGAIRDKALLGRAWALYKLKQYPNAEKCLVELVEHDKTNFEAQYWLGLVRAADKRWTEAIAPLEVATENKPLVGQARVALAICYLHADRPQDAKRTYAAFEHDKPSLELWNLGAYQLAEAALEKDPSWAAELFRSLAKQGKTSVYRAKALSGLAWCQFRLADFAAAGATFEQLLKEFPEDPLAAEAALVRGQTLEKLDQADSALAMYHRVIEKYPSSQQLAEALWRAAPIEHRLGHRDQATGWLQRLRKEFPQSERVPEATYRLAQWAREHKDYQNALSLTRELIVADPPLKLLPQALYLQGRIAVEQEAWSDVDPPLERLVRDFSDNHLVPAARYWMAEASYRRKDYEQAIKLFSELEQDSKARTQKWLPMTSLRQAQSLGQLDRWPEALEVAERIGQKYPDFAEQYEADYLIGRALASQAEFDGAREAYSKVVHSPRGAKTETAAMAQWMIGETYFHQENYEAAIAAYLRVEILYAWPKWQAAALLQAGKCQETVGRWNEAIDTYDRLVTRFANTDYTAEAKRRLTVARQRASQNQKSAKRK